MMLRKIRVYGKLAKQLGQRVFEADVATAAEAVRFLLANFPKLEPVIAQGHYRVSVGRYDIEEQELHHPTGQQDISIVPVVSGAGGAGKIIAGIALVVASVFIGPGAMVLGTSLKLLVAGLGVSLTIGGVAQLLTPIPQLNLTGADSQDDPRRSYSFTGLQQSSRQGVPVPIVYGEMIVGSVVVSGGIDTVQVKG